LIKSYLENSVKLSKWIIKIAGEGPEQDRLKKLNKRYKQIEFLGKKKIRRIKKDNFSILFNNCAFNLARKFPL